MPLMPHPWVYSAKITDGKITFRVEVTDFKPTAGVIEVSGQATQVGGAFAPIYAISEVPAKPNGDENEEEERGRSFVDVEADPTPEHPFTGDQDVTVFVRVSKVWVTVLGEGTDDPKPTPRVNGGPTWGKHKTDAHISKPSRPSTSSS
jgi:hypothetical protein